MNFSVVNLGCKVNRVESDAAAAQLLAAGGTATSAHEADLIIVNTCTVTGEAEKKTRKAVRQALRANAFAQVVVTGCAAAIDAAYYESLDARVRVVLKAALSEEIGRMIAAERATSDVSNSHTDGSLIAVDVPDGRATALAEVRAGKSFPTRVGVKVQDGCNNACTFCIVHVARGRATSRPSAEIVEECAQLARAGVREIVLTGINLGSYWEDAPAGCGDVRLSGLLRLLLDATVNLHAPDEPPCRFRVSSIEPRDVDDDLVNLMAQSNGRICRHLHLPLQSGSEKVLREMARPYHADDYRALVSRLRAVLPQLSLSTDIIVGFPGETEGDFAQTLAMACDCAFSKIHVFPYSRREGTPAAARADQVPAEEKAARAAALRDLGEQLRQSDYARRVGLHELVLVEGSGCAMTESYYEIAAPQGSVSGSLVDAVLPAHDESCG